MIFVEFLRRYQTGILSFILLSLAPFTFFVPRSAVWILGVLGTLGFLVVPSAFPSSIKQRYSLYILAFILWGMISSLWSIDPKSSFILSWRLAGAYLLGMSWLSLFQHLSSEQKQKVSNYFINGLIIAALLIEVDSRLGNVWQTWVGKTSAKAFVPLSLTIAMGFWPWILWSKEQMKNWFIPIFAFGIIFILGRIDCDTSPFALICGILAAISSYLLPRFANKAMRVGSVLVIMLLPFAFSNFLTSERIKDINASLYSFSYIHRLYVWHAVSEKIQQNPALGYGLDTSRHEMIGGEMKDWPFATVDGKEISIHSKEIPMHPHNAPLQWWLELGIIGAILGALAVQEILKQIGRIHSKYHQALATGLFTTASMIALINLGFWQSWWIAVLWIIAGFMRTFEEKQK